MQIFLYVYVGSGAIVAILEGLLLEKSAQDLYKKRKMASLELATQSVLFGTFILSVIPVLNTLHLLVKTINIFVKLRYKVDD